MYILGTLPYCVFKYLSREFAPKKLISLRAPAGVGCICHLRLSNAAAQPTLKPPVVAVQHYLCRIQDSRGLPVF